MKPLSNFVHPTGIYDSSQYSSRYAQETTGSIRDSTQNEYTCPPDHVNVGAPTTVIQSVKTLSPVQNEHPTRTHPKTVFSADSNSSLTTFSVTFRIRFLALSQLILSCILHMFPLEETS